MNRVYRQGETVPLTSEELAIEANAIQKPQYYQFKASDFEGENSRIAGEGHCYCNDNGDFELVPADDPSVIEGGKRYMLCRNCGGMSHL